ncbi:MAG TPA: site-specific integrase [Gemmatimonadaceae bacterium]|jgi:integrase|nr:site-specific integrase [Gemmatimonadaceae bacterium]
MRLDKVMPVDMRALYATMFDKGLTSRTVKKTHVILKAVFQQAITDRTLLWNPCTGQRIPTHTPKTYRILTGEEVARIIAAPKDERVRFYSTSINHVLWTLMLNTGMRPQEALALKWDDLKDGKLTIERALVRVTAGTYTVGPTKTKKSRTISIPAATLAALAAHKTQQTTLILKLGSYYKRQGLIFATREGEYLSPMNMFTAWERMLKRLNIPQTRLYECRHTHASMLLTAGWPVKAVSERLGHASAKMTLDVYAHTLPNTDAETAAFFDRLIAPKAVAS